MKNLIFILLILFSVALYSSDDLVEVSITTGGKNGIIQIQCSKFCKYNDKAKREFNRINNCEGVYYKHRVDADHYLNQLLDFFGIQQQEEIIGEDGKYDYTGRMSWYGKSCNQCARTRLCIYKYPIEKIKEHCQCSENISPGNFVYKKKKLKKKLRADTREELEKRYQIIDGWKRCHYPIDTPPAAETSILCNETPSGQHSVRSAHYKTPDDWTTTMRDLHGQNAPLCLAGDMDRCADTGLSQDLTSDFPNENDFNFGAWYRAPHFKDRTDYHVEDPMARDHMTGILAYLAVMGNKDRDRARMQAVHWLNFIARNNKVTRFDNKAMEWVKYFNGCPNTGLENPDTAYVDSCAILADFWGLIYEVYKSLGLIKWIKKEHNDIWWAMQYGAMIDGPMLVVQATTTTINGQIAFQAYLLGLNVMIRNYLGKSTWLTRWAADILSKRSEHQNPLFEYLVHGATNHGGNLILRYCPAKVPEAGTIEPRTGAEVAPGWILNGPVFLETQLPYGGYSVHQGHDCQGWMNLYLDKFKSCPGGKSYQGDYKDSWPICKGWVKKTYTEKSCVKKGGVIWNDTCLFKVDKKYGYYLQHELALNEKSSEKEPKEEVVERREEAQIKIEDEEIPEDIEPSLAELKLYPNPVRRGDNLTIEIKSTKAQRVTVTFLNINNQKNIQKSFDLHIGQNKKLLHMNMVEFGANGLYQVIATSADQDGVLVGKVFLH